METSKCHHPFYCALSLMFCSIPLTFLLGFYVNAVFGRWSEIFNNLGWIDSPALLITTYVKGDDETARKIRRNIIRYMVPLPGNN